MASEWVEFSLREVCTKIGSGATPRGGSSTYCDSGPYSLIRSQNVYNDGFHHDGLAFISEQQASELANAEVKDGDVLLNITGDSVARVCQVDSDVLPARVNQHVAIVRPDPQKLNPRFLRYMLVSPQAQSKLLSWAGAGATRNALTKGMIDAFDVFAPREIEEQAAIADTLGVLDDKIEVNRRMNETLEAMTRALFKSWFVDFDPVRAKAEGRPTGLPVHIASLFPDTLVESPLGPVPRGWEITTWGIVATLEYGKSLSGYNTETGIYPVYGTNGRIGTCSKPLCPYPGVIIGRKGAYRGVHYSPSPFFAIDTAFYVAPKIPIELRWAYYELLRQDINGMDSGSAIPSTSREDFYSLPVVLAPNTVQQCYVNLMEPSWQKQEQNRRSSLVLAKLRDSLLPVLISGKLRISSDFQVGACL